MPKYKWETPYEWLMDKVNDMSEQDLKNTVLNIARKCDSDTLQDIFESDMDEDGYFDKICRVCGHVESLHEGDDKECPVQTRVGTDYFAE